MSPSQRPSFGVPIGRIALRRVPAPRASSPVLAFFEERADRPRHLPAAEPARPAGSPAA